MNIDKKYQVKENDLFVKFGFDKISDKFDIIFLDPPYKEKKLSNLIDEIYKKKILNDDGIIIIHRHKKEKDKFSNKLKILDEKKYGTSKILFGKLN